MKATTAYKQEIEENAFKRSVAYDKFNEVRKEVRVDILYKLHCHTKVAAEVYGKLVYLTEPEVRALQVLAKRKAKESAKAFLEFTSNVVVYSGASKRSSKHIMMFSVDGSFVNDFEPGFFDVNYKLANELI